jgi:vacuolar-type H+-ATPase subunit H
MFSQAQLIAEGMVEDVSRDARARIEQAREHERKIVEQAVSAAGKHVHEYARSAQAQMQSIMESFAQEVDQLGVVAASGDVPGAVPGAMPPVMPGLMPPAMPGLMPPAMPAPTDAPTDAATQPASHGEGAQPGHHRNGAEVVHGES